MTTFNDEKLQSICETHRGEHYNDARQSIASHDWDGYYPEVDKLGRLTGNLIPADAYGYSVCDVGDCVIIHGTAMDAVIVDGE